jgi:short-subunit dehydrogenase
MLLKNNKIQKGIVCIGSICGKKSFKFGASYGASKFGIRGFAMQLKNELSSISVHLINPKIVDTNFHKNSKIEIA